MLQNMRLGRKGLPHFAEIRQRFVRRAIQKWQTSRPRSIQMEKWRCLRWAVEGWQEEWPRSHEI